jgi:tetratricopeptide (TPR) repeat protein
LVVLTALEESPAAQQDPLLRAAAMVQRGRVYYWRKLIQNEGEWERCLTLFREALALSEEHRSAKGQAEALFHVGLVYQLQRGLKRARPFFERSLAAAREAGDRLQQSSAHRHLGFADEEAGQWDEALAHHQQALSLREQMSYSRGVMFQLSSVGHVLCVGKQDCAAAEPYFLRAAVLALELDEPLGEVEARMGLGRVAQSRNEGPLARKQFDAALLAARRAGDPVSEAQVGLALSEVLAEAGQRSESLRALETAWELLVRSGQSHKSREVVNALIRLRGS